MIRAAISIALIAFFSLAQQVESQELLKWRPGLGVTPEPKVFADRLNFNDVAEEDMLGSLGWYWPFSSLLKTFTNMEPDKISSFRDQFRDYAYVVEVLHPAVHPVPPQPDNTNVQLFTYMKPYDYHQVEFLDWLELNMGRTDFVEPLARRNNDYKGDLISPLVTDEASITETVSKQTYGQMAIFDPNEVILISDNRYNPHRYMAPVNETHHREQAALTFAVETNDGVWEQTRDILQEWRGGTEDEHICLDYAVEITVEDYRDDFNESSVWGIYDGLHPSASQNLTGVQHWNAYLYGSGASAQDAFGQERTIDPVAGQAMLRYVDTRVIPDSLHVSLSINWLQEDPYYRLTDWTLASRGYQRSIYDPGPWGTPGFWPTSNMWLNPHVTEGGNSGDVAWHRHPIDFLNDSLFTKIAPTYAPIQSGGVTWAIPDGDAMNTLWGRIDLTKYYILSRGDTFFPGQEGWWVYDAVGFELDPGDEQHGINWVGVVIENHSMSKVKAEIFYLDLFVGPCDPV